MVNAKRVDCVSLHLLQKSYIVAMTSRVIVAAGRTRAILAMTSPVIVSTWLGGKFGDS